MNDSRNSTTEWLGWRPIACMILLVSILIPLTRIPASGQALQRGEAVATCFSGQPSPTTPIIDDFVIGIIDVRTPPTTLHAYWPTVPMRHPPSWKSGRLGQVYGIAVDKRGLIYTTATRAYYGSCYMNIPYVTSDPRRFGSAGPGGIYQLDPASGMVVDLVTSVPFSTASVIGTRTLPNGSGMTVPYDGPGLGNITYDPVRDKLFVTNMEDGKIYQIEAIPGATQGTVLSVYDPSSNVIGCGNLMAVDGGASGFAPLGELLWGIGYHRGENRIYYSVWVEDAGLPSASGSNAIRSVGLFAAGPNAGQLDPSTDRLEICLPAYAGGSWSMPVSDIEFSGDGRKMLLGERGARSQPSSSATPTGIHCAYPHQSRTLEYRGATSAWVLDKQISVGLLSSSNSAGGVDFGYRNYSRETATNIDCDSVIWSSGDYLFNASGGLVYGLQRAPESGNVPLWTSTGPFIDLNGVLGTGDKNQVGDVDIYRAPCGPPDPCEARVTLRNVAANGQCCWRMLLSNPTPNTFLAVQIDILSAGATFSSVSSGTGWTTDLLDPTQLVQSPSGTGFIPVGGAIDAGTFCLNLIPGATTPQVIQVTWIGINGVTCTQRLQVDCTPPVQGICITLVEPRITCTSDGPGSSAYSLSFRIRNDAIWPIEKLMFSSSLNVTVSPSSIWVSPAIAPGTISSQVFTLAISGPDADAGKNLCINFKVIDTTTVIVNGVPDTDQANCCLTTVCFQLPKCPNCCDGFQIAGGTAPPAIPYDAAGNVTLNTSFTVGPANVTAVSATIISSSMTQLCPGRQPNGTVFGDITGGTLGAALPGPTLTPIAGPSHEISWGKSIVGVPMTTPTPLTLQLLFPPTPCMQWWGAPICRDVVRFSVRYRFTDVSCRTCDTVIDYQLTRRGGLCFIVYVDPVLRSDLSIGRDIVETPRRVQPGEEIGTIAMSSLTQGKLTVVIPALASGEDTSSAIILTELSLSPTAGVNITSMTDDTDGKSATIVDQTARIALNLRQTTREIRRTFTLRYNNYASLTSFVNHVGYRYADAEGAGDTLTYAEEVLAVTPGASGGDLVARDSSTILRNVRTYALYFRNANGSRRAITGIRLSVDRDQEILAAGPFAEKQSVTISGWDSSGVTGFGKANVAELSLAPGAMLRPIYLTVAGGPNRDLKIRWTTLDGPYLVTDDSMVISNPFSLIRGGEEGTTGGAHLYAPRPNPASASTMFQVYLDHASIVDLVVTDQLGSVVATVVASEALVGGEHLFVFDSGALASGSYFVTLRTPTGVETRPLTIVR